MKFTKTRQTHFLRHQSRKKSVGLLQGWITLLLVNSLILISQSFVIAPQTDLKISKPAGTIKNKITPTHPIVYIHVSNRIKSKSRTNCFPRRAVIQVNDKFATIKDIKYALPPYRCPEGKYCYPKVVLRVDQEVKIGVIDDIKTELRKRNWILVHYAQEQVKN